MPARGGRGAPVSASHLAGASATIWLMRSVISEDWRRRSRKRSEETSAPWILDTSPSL